MRIQQHESYIDLAIKHYSSLFKLPSIKCIITLLCMESLLLGLIVNIPFTLFLWWVINSLLLGISIFAVTVFSEYFIVKLLLRREIILNFRRALFLSFSSNILLVIFTAISRIFVFQGSGESLIMKIFSIGFFAALSLRFLVIKSISFSNIIVRVLSSALQPLIILILISPVKIEELNIYYVVYIISALITSISSVWLFTRILDKDGIEKFGIPSLKIFRAFLADWTENFEQPFEEILDHLGEERDITVSLLIFRGKRDGKIKTIIVVPNLHPGPFKNIGSSPLPSLMMDFLEKELNCIISVPHGISGHELDIVSQVENKRVLEGVLKAVSETNVFSDKVTNFFVIEKDGAKVGCQVFNECVLLTLTTAPETIEDLPLELNDFIIQRAKEGGFSWAIAIDAHNSINGPFDMERSIKTLKDAVSLALERARDLKGLGASVKVGAGKVVPKDLGIRDGMGPGGITGIVIEVSGQRTAYITIDGNNMMSGLREKILWSLEELGIDCGEVFTTDTHIVNAVVLNKRGYHPIGEVINHDKIINYVKYAVSEALKNMDQVEVAWHKTVIPKVKVIGERQINELSLLTDIVSKKARESSIIFVVLGLLLAISLTSI
ncbi:MAG: DUF2070 family protein [Candidatus Bathyarchaeia archaeon]